MSRLDRIVALVERDPLLRGGYGIGWGYLGTTFQNDGGCR